MAKAEKKMEPTAVFVPRPASSRRGGWPKWAGRDAFLQTEQNGQAVRIALNGTELGTWYRRIQYCASSRGLKGHVRRDGPDHIIAWAEKKTHDTP